MKLLKLTLAALTAATCLSATAAVSAYAPVVSAMDMARSESGTESLYVSYTVDREAWRIPSNTEVVLTPVVCFEGDSVTLPQLILAGRNAYLAHRRNDDLPKGADLVRAKGEPLQRNVRLPWQPGMEQCELKFRAETRGCRCSASGSETLPDFLVMDFGPKEFPLIIPRRQLAALEQKVDEVVKTRSLAKSAYVNYKVGSSQLLPDFKSNPVELAAILATIDSVRNDKDLTVDHVEIHGYASPEGSFALNKKLAAGRTDALRAYVDSHYGFGSKLTTASTPEDWAGLRAWVAASVMTNKDAILALIDSDMEPDAKDAALKSRFPADYALLLEQVYPTLRRSDYRIEYTVRTFTEPETIARMLQTDPGKLSMEEIMLLARTYKEGSEEREDLMLKAAELFPTDPRTQLNAAFVALSRGNHDQAGRLLKRSGDSPLADYGRGVLALYAEDYVTAEPLLNSAKSAGVEGAAEALEFLSRKRKK